jgi:hypothetical protein
LPEIFRILHVSKKGVAILVDRDNVTRTAHVQTLVPCHLSDVSPIIDPRLQPNYRHNCDLCNEPTTTSDSTVCLGCKRIWHRSCNPHPGCTPLVCEDCKTANVVPAGPVLDSPGSDPRENGALFPSAPQALRDAAAAALHGRRIRKKFANSWFLGTLHFIGPRARPWYFEARRQGQGDAAPQ